MPFPMTPVRGLNHGCEEDHQKSCEGPCQEGFAEEAGRQEGLQVSSRGSSLPQSDSPDNNEKG
jgi:hypothetical protein